MNNLIKQVYVCAPSGYASGGPEALHQLANEIKLLGYNVKMFYYAHNTRIERPNHKNYDIYDLNFTTNYNDLQNDGGNYIIVPETACDLLNIPNTDKMKKIVWWLSVDFFFKAHQLSLDNSKKYFGLKRFFKKYRKFPNLDELKDIKNVSHLPNSYYTLKFLEDNGIDSLAVVSDYLNENYTCQNTDLNLKENIIIYNPVKNGAYLEKIKQRTKELNWIAIKGMSQAEVKVLMNTAKVYIDFGFHPGRERMPREACLAKCCLIIGKEGAAKYKEDMPIPDEYHFESTEENIDEIANLIFECFSNYEHHVNKFFSYEENILNARQRFSLEVKKLIEEIK